METDRNNKEDRKKPIRRWLLSEDTVDLLATIRANIRRAAVDARAAGWSGDSSANVVTLVWGVDNRCTNDTGVVDSDRVGRRLMLSEILSDMCHGYVVERDISNLTLAVVVGVPHLNITLLQVSEALKRNRSSALASKVHGSLHHVTRSTTVVCAGTVAVLGDGRESMRGVETNTASAVHRTLKLRQVVRTREGLLGASGTKLIRYFGVEVGEEKAGATEGSLLHYRRVAELLDQSFTALDCGIRYLSSLRRAVGGPTATLDTIDEGDHTTNICEVDEGIAYIAARLEVNAEVEEIVGAEANFVKNRLE